MRRRGRVSAKEERPGAGGASTKRGDVVSDARAILLRREAARGLRRGPMRRRAALLLADRSRASHARRRSPMLTPNSSPSLPPTPPRGEPASRLPLRGCERELTLAILRGRLTDPARLEPRDLAMLAALFPRLVRSELGRPASALLAAALVLLRDGCRRGRAAPSPERLRRVARRALGSGRGRDPRPCGEAEWAWFAHQARLAAELLLRLPLSLFTAPTLAPLAEALAPRLGHRADPDLVEVLSEEPVPEDDDQDGGTEDGGGPAFGLHARP